MSTPSQNGKLTSEQKPKTPEEHAARVKIGGLVTIIGLNLILATICSFALFLNAPFANDICEELVTVIIASLTAMGGFVVGQSASGKNSR